MKTTATFCEVEKARLSDLFGGRRYPKVPSQGNLEFTGSGKAAISLILKFLRLQGILGNKTSEILVPQWMGSWIYAQIHNDAFPALRYGTRTRAVYVYHQYGFPQDMDRILDFAQDRKLTVIEDCAHSIVGKFKGRDLGTFGDFALYSFSKYFFCYALGAVKGKKPEFLTYVREQVNDTPKCITMVNNCCAMVNSLYENKRMAPQKNQAASLIMSASYGLYNFGFAPSQKAIALYRRKIGDELETRTKRYLLFLKEMDGFGVCDHLEREGVCPYVIPIKMPESAQESTLNKLRDAGYQTGIYRFDYGRFFLEPKFGPCLWIFLHGGLTDGQFYRQIDIVKNVLLGVCK